MATATLEDLKKVIALSDLPDEHLQWILDHSDVREYEDGNLIAKTGEPADLMYFILEGRIDFYLDVNGRLVFYFYFTNDHTTGGAGGLLPYSRMKTYAGCSYAVGETPGAGTP
jgi:signal-transduction protein with cAMP-binding, CBS, and nucleotidyltransferase domain